LVVIDPVFLVNPNRDIVVSLFNLTPPLPSNSTVKAVDKGS